MSLESRVGNQGTHVGQKPIVHPFPGAGPEKKDVCYLHLTAPLFGIIQHLFMKLNGPF